MPLTRFQPLAPHLLLAALLASGCITTTESQPPGIEEREVAKALAVRSWLAQGPPGPALGCVVRLESPDDDQRFFYVVRNLYGQDLGLIDLHGRAFRYRPHQEEAEVLGSGTVAEGARRVLDAAETVQLIEIPVGDLEKRLGQERQRKTARRRPVSR